MLQSILWYLYFSKPISHFFQSKSKSALRDCKINIIYNILL